MIYREYRIKEIGAALSNITGFVSAYILFYMLFAIPIDFSAIILVTGIFILGFVGNSYLFHRMLSKRKRVFKDDLYDIIKITIFSLSYAFFRYMSGKEEIYFTSFCVGITGLFLALLIKGFVINDALYEKMRQRITSLQ